jgi:hypothetical protein
MEKSQPILPWETSISGMVSNHLIPKGNPDGIPGRILWLTDLQCGMERRRNIRSLTLWEAALTASLGW